MSETTTERFERIAAEYYEDTGRLAPGKDEPASLGEVNMDDRWEHWREWLVKRGRLKATRILAGIEDPEDFVRSVRELVDAIGDPGPGWAFYKPLAVVREHLPDEEE